jgi:hypothetical protein
MVEDRMAKKKIYKDNTKKFTFYLLRGTKKSIGNNMKRRGKKATSVPKRKREKKKATS